MQFKIDENLPIEVAAELQALGHDVQTVHDEGLVGADDPVILARVQAEGRALITLDKGIADVRRFPPANYHGIILLRPRSTGRLATLAFVRQHLPQVLQGSLDGRLVVVSDSGVRLR